MEFKFYKYQGAGNDFILFDNRNGSFPHSNTQLYNQLCDRKFGIGADGLMLLENTDSEDFKMVYFNADGNQSSMCGNGGRCIVRFAADLGLIKNECNFLAVDGLHYAKISDNMIELQMIDVEEWISHDHDLELNTGSPHYIKWVDNIKDVDVFKAGRSIRYNDQYKSQGINVNFVEPFEHGLKVRTYERGVEDETLSCGTGVTAAALAFAVRNNLQGSRSVQIQTPGGTLQVSFNRTDNSFNQVFLKGPAVKVFEGIIDLSQI